MGHFELFDEKSYDLNKNSKKGILILHGFSSSTYETVPLGKYLSKKGFRVLIPNLPGHGTTIEDCNAQSFYDWLDFVDIKLAELSSECDEVSVIGLSMGAVLSLYLASFFPVKKLIVCAAVLKFKNPFVVNFLIPVVNKIFVKQKKVSTNPNKRYSGYDHYPLIALNEFRKLNKVVIKKLHKVTCSALYVHSKKDGLSLPYNMDLVMNSISSKNKERLIVDHASHHLFYESADKDIIFSRINNFMKKES
tara:strand:+ start:255 stop:1001 length:747 start_codon:yes stop_codon:yes gene_type:complete